jgi:hypothetical protein
MRRTGSDSWSARPARAPGLLRSLGVHRPLLVLSLAAGMLVAPAAVSAVSRATSDIQPPTVLQLGDVVTVSAAPVGCIARVRQNVRVLDCRRLGRHTGTYAAIISARGVLVARYENERVAKVVFSARHQSRDTKTCR